MDERLSRTAARHRALLEEGRHDREAFRAALIEVPALDRDGWLNEALGLEELPEDGPALPKDGVPYLPCAVEPLLRLIEEAPVTERDVFVDIGSGVGRTAVLVHLLTGATSVGLEIQPQLVEQSRALAARLKLESVRFVEGDASAMAACVTDGTVFFLYCPFSGERLSTLLSNLEPLARARPLRIATVDLPLPPRPWLELQPSNAGDLALHRTTLHQR